MGEEETIADGIRYAAARGAQIINLAFEFDSRTFRAGADPADRERRALRARPGALIVGAAGNTTFDEVAYPAALPGVVSVGAVTEHLCLAEYSNTGEGSTSSRPAAARTLRCSAASPAAGRRGRTGARSCSWRSRRADATFRYTRDLQGHVDGGRARLGDGGADHRLGRARPAARRARQIEVRLKTTARDLGRPGKDLQYGAGLIDAGAATAR